MFNEFSLLSIAFQIHDMTTNSYSTNKEISIYYDDVPSGTQTYVAPHLPVKNVKFFVSTISPSQKVITWGTTETNIKTYNFVRQIQEYLVLIDELTG